MYKNKLVLALLLCVGGCATTQPTKPPEPIQVEVPVRVPCTIDEPQSPQLSFEKLKEDSTLYEKVRVLLADRLLHLGYEEQLRTALRGCKQ